MVPCEGELICSGREEGDDLKASFNHGPTLGREIDVFRVILHVHSGKRLGLVVGDRVGALDDDASLPKEDLSVYWSEWSEKANVNRPGTPSPHRLHSQI